MLLSPDHVSLPLAQFTTIFKPLCSFPRTLHTGLMLFPAQSLSCAWLFATPWTVAHQAPLSMGILQGRILKWVAMPSSRESSQPRDRAQVSGIACGFFTDWAAGKARTGFNSNESYVITSSSPSLPVLITIWNSFLLHPPLSHCPHPSSH